MQRKNQDSSLTPSLVLNNDVTKMSNADIRKYNGPGPTYGSGLFAGMGVYDSV